MKQEDNNRSGNFIDDNQNGDPEIDRNDEEKEQIILNNHKIENPIEIVWNNLNIYAVSKVKIKGNDKNAAGSQAQTVVQRKQILKNLHGVARPGHFTAILGPSGSGKTTLLNFLSGRLVSKNLEITGELMLNGDKVTDINEFSDQIAYVMQDDILFGTFTPRESFEFTARLRLSHKTEQERQDRVESLIHDLGLTYCADTNIGSELTRGISGGERKRTSIGVELLTDPKVLFLDEPTTGLDSTTAKQVCLQLDRLAQQGVNVICTIHQPSSEIFDSFETLILLVDGNIIFQGPAKQSVRYFSDLGYPCPLSFNPSDFFMKLMSQDGLIENEEQVLQYDEMQVKADFEKRVNLFVENFNSKNDQKTQKLQADIPALLGEGVVKSPDHQQCSIYRQFMLLFLRGVIHQYRSKSGILLRTFQNIIFILAFIIVFNNLGTGVSGIQTRNGALFFMIACQAFAAITGTLASFSMERSVFLRERATKSYSVGAYFWGKTLAELPLQIFYPVMFVSVIYYWVGLNNQSISTFLVANLVCVLIYWYGSSYGQLISVLVPKFEVAVALVPAFIIPLMVLSGFFVSTQQMPVYWRYISYISMYRYGYEAACINEFTDEMFYGPGGQEINPLEVHDFQLSLVADCILMFGLGILIRLIALIGLYRISNPSRPKIQAVSS